jgi:hypothetical protein
MAMGAGDFTVECWVNLSAVTVNFGVVLELRASGATTTGFVVNLGPSGGGYILNFYTSGAGNPGSIVMPFNAWNHIAVVRSSGVIKLYSNGAVAASFSNSNTYSDTPAPTIAFSAAYGGAASDITGYVSNLRVVKGVAVYTGVFTPPTSPLQKTQSSGTNISAITGSQTSLLTCQSNRFIDNSNNTFTVTPTGTPQVTPYFYPSGFTAPAASPGAALFNGSSQYLTSPFSSNLNLGSSNFTIEAWVYFNSFPSNDFCTIYSYANSNGLPRLSFYFDTRSSQSSPGLRFSVVDASNSTLVDFNGGGTSGWNINSWYHIAITRSTNTWTLYRNGISVGTTTNSSSIPAVTNNGVSIGKESGVSNLFNGYVGNLRVVKGTAVYTGAFTPPSGPLTQTGGTYPSLTNVVTGFSAANTTLLLGLADSNYNSATNGVQNNTFIDESNYAFPITRNGTPTQGSITPYWPNGQWSNYFPGGANDYFTIGTQSILNVGTGNFTVECFIFFPGRSTTYSRESILAPTEATIASGVAIQLTGSTQGSTGISTTVAGTTISSATAISANTWHHVAVVRSSGVVTIYVDGTSRASNTAAGSLSNTASYAIGSLRTTDPQYNDVFQGYISNFRTTSTAVYSGSPITVPTSPLSPSTANQTLLTCYSNRFIDANTATTAKTITANGTPRVQAFQPFSPTASYTTALYGGSGYFNGSTDYLSAPDSDVFLLTGDFTIEAWVYQTSSKGVTIVGQWPITGVVSFICKVQSTGKLGFTYDLGAGGVNGADSTNAITYNSWNHVVWSRSGSTQRYFINGVLDATTNAISGSFVNSAGALTIGLYNTGADTYFNGYLSSVRFVKGTAVYTGAFTPPTLAPLATTGPASAASYSSTTNVNTTFLTPASLLLNMANAGIYDAAAQNDVTTVSNAQVSIAQSQWPPSSIFFNGATSSLSIPSSTAFGLGTGDWTIEFWIYLNAAPPTAITLVSMLTNASGAGFAPHIYCVTGGGLRYYTNSADRITGGVLASGVWNYVAVSKSSGNTRMYINGTQTGSTYPDSNNYGTANPFAVADYAVPLAGGTVNGYFQDVRITKGVGRTITASPTAAFPTR